MTEQKNNKKIPLMDNKYYSILSKIDVLQKKSIKNDTKYTKITSMLDDQTEGLIEQNLKLKEILENLKRIKTNQEQSKIQLLFLKNNEIIKYILLLVMIVIFYYFGSSTPPFDSTFEIAAQQFLENQGYLVEKVDVLSTSTPETTKVVSTNPFINPPVIKPWYYFSIFK